MTARDEANCTGPAVPARLFPHFVRHVTLFGVGPNPDDGSSSSIGDIEATYVRELRGMGANRRADFLAGRRCAAAAIAAWAPELAGAPVPIGEDRAPRWPGGLVGAITHAAGVASAAVARASDAWSLGLDIETRVGADEAAELRDSVVCGRELELARSALGLDEASGVTLLFSAKETVYKALAPIVRRYFDYREAELVGADPAARRCSLRVAVDLSSQFPAGFTLDVRFAFDSRYVHTGAVLLPTDR